MKTVKIVAAATLLAGTAVAAPLASASASFTQCDSGYVCLWGNRDYQWLIQERAGGYNAWYNLSGEANNQMDSWGNRSIRNARGTDGFNGGGYCQTFAAGSRDDNVAPYNSDKVSATNSGGGC